MHCGCRHCPAGPPSRCSWQCNLPSQGLVILPLTLVCQWGLCGGSRGRMLPWSSFSGLSVKQQGLGSFESKSTGRVRDCLPVPGRWGPDPFQGPEGHSPVEGQALLFCLLCLLTAGTLICSLSFSGSAWDTKGLAAKSGTPSNFSLCLLLGEAQ